MVLGYFFSCKVVERARLRPCLGRLAINVQEWNVDDAHECRNRGISGKGMRIALVSVKAGISADGYEVRRRSNVCDIVKYYNRDRLSLDDEICSCSQYMIHHYGSLEG